MPDASLPVRRPAFIASSRFGLIPSLAAYAALYEGAARGQIWGDISTHHSYCWPEHTAACMHRYVPEVRIIAILRQPADHAYSAFNMMRQKGLEPLADFAAALAACRGGASAGQLGTAAPGPSG